MGTKIFIFGGHDGKSCLNDVHILVTMNWRAVEAKGGRPNPRVGCTLNCVANQLILIGGAANEQSLNDVRIFEMESDLWTVPTVSGTPPAALVRRRKPAAPPRHLSPLPCSAQSGRGCVSCRSATLRL